VYVCGQQIKARFRFGPVSVCCRTEQVRAAAYTFARPLGQFVAGSHNRLLAATSHGGRNEETNDRIQPDSAYGFRPGL
jgi:hypothetical protein